MAIGGMRVGSSPMGVVRGCIGRGTFGGAWGSVASGRPRDFVAQGNQGRPPLLIVSLVPWFQHQLHWLTEDVPICVE